MPFTRRVPASSAKTFPVNGGVWRRLTALKWWLGWKFATLPLSSTLARFGLATPVSLGQFEPLYYSRLRLVDEYDFLCMIKTKEVECDQDV